MEGITNGLAGVDNIELLQIQEFSAWRTNLKSYGLS